MARRSKFDSSSPGRPRCKAINTVDGLRCHKNSEYGSELCSAHRRTDDARGSVETIDDRAYETRARHRLGIPLTHF